MYAEYAEINCSIKVYLNFIYLQNN